MREPQPITVVVADDGTDERRSVVQCLEESGFRVLEAQTGAEALRLVRTQPDVAILDVQLPDIDGFRVLTRLAALAVRPAVVLISTREAADYGSRVARSGAAGFITKADLSVEALARAVGSR